MFDKQIYLKAMSTQEERLLLAKVLDQAGFSLDKHKPMFTDFLDRAKSTLFLECTQRIRELSSISFGGYEDCERSMLGFVPDYMELSLEDFPIRLLRITKNNIRFGQQDLTHRDYLGSILGLGIDRGKVGDILLEEDATYCFVHSEIQDYVCSNLYKVSHTNVNTEVISLNEWKPSEKELSLKRMTVASLRLDAVAGTVFHLSRGKVQDYIRSEKTNVNWAVVNNSSKLLKEGDMVSIRGFGRFRLEEVLGKTKKDRIGIMIREYGLSK